MNKIKSQHRQQPKQEEENEEWQEEVEKICQNKQQAVKLSPSIIINHIALTVSGDAQKGPRRDGGK